MWRGWRRQGSASVRLMVATALLVPMAAALIDFTVASADATPLFIPKEADWLTTVNYYRAMSGLTPVTEDPVLSDGSLKHSCYMLQNDISHDEIAGRPGYTAEGRAAGTDGNVAVSSVFNERARSHIELWMTGPFHAIGVLRPNLKTVGFGKCDMSTTPRWHSGATLDVLHGLGPTTPMAGPILFPGNGTTTNLNRFVVETPDPLAFCGWTGAAGLPVMALLPQAPTGAVSATISGPTGPLETCTLSSLNTTGVAQAILGGNNVVVAIPRAPLADGSYAVRITTSNRTVDWSFTVDQTAANPPATAVTPVAPVTPVTPVAPVAPVAPAAAPAATPGGASAGFQAISPVRLVDTREQIGASRLTAQTVKRIQITGLGVVPAGASAMSANVTVTNPTGPGYLTAWNCSGDRPVVASLNFVGGETVPNGVTVPLDATGAICVYSPVATDLIIDVNGYYAISGRARFSSISPTRLLDTRTGLGGSTRLGDGATVRLQVGGLGGIPAAAAAVTLNVASVDPLEAGFVTVYPCDQPRPLAASLNPQPGKVKPNLVISQLAVDGSICVYSLHEVDLVVDAMGYLADTSTSRFTSTVPFRFTDTRDAARPEVNSGTFGNVLGAGQTLRLQIAGQRGVPAGTMAVTINIAVTNAGAAGFITAWPCGDRPNTANVNYEAQAPISNGAQVPLSADGQLCVYTLSSAHVIIDVNGWWG